jgi:ATP-dependent exoDNAse (exonuclease V) alpha subunit
VRTVTGVTDGGSLHVKHDRRGASAVLPAGYVAADVVLGYATTITGGQGRTVDRGHVVVTPSTTSASLYVGKSRGRDSNHAHVVCDSHDHTEFELGGKASDNQERVLRRCRVALPRPPVRECVAR